MANRMIAVQGVFSAVAVASTASIYSNPVKMGRSIVGAGILAVVAGTTPDLNIFYEVSVDGVNFYQPVNTSGTTLAVVIDALTATKWISFNPVAAPYIRIKITGDGSNGADVTVTTSLIFQEII